MCMQAPVVFAVSQATGQPGYVVTVTNKNWFTTTEALVFSFRLLADGVPIRQEAEEGWTQFDIAHIPPQVPLPPPLGIHHVLSPANQTPPPPPTPGPPEPPAPPELPLVQLL